MTENWIENFLNKYQSLKDSNDSCHRKFVFESPILAHVEDLALLMSIDKIQ